MCGIAGFSAIKQPTIHVEAILGSLDHRGPDDRGTWTDGLVSLFHTRLSIIDLSTAARQPFGDATGRYVLIYNGEIYNYRELRETIPYNWTTSSDTEVLLAALIRHGEKALSMLEGMFAFAFFDKETREMIIARDRLGKKPLYYTADENALSFASEVRTLLKINGKPGVISRQNLSNWLFLQSIPGEETLVNSVKRVLPGEYLKVKDNRITERKRFWDPSDCIAGNEFEGKPTKDTLKTLVTEAISKRLESDVPLACFLSGGVDSSIITAVASQQVSGKLATFHLAFREEGYSEHSMARLVAERYKTDHHECFLESNELLDALPDALSACDHPSGDGLNTYVLSKKVQEFGFKATLSGLGADEWFVGYSYFRDFEKWRKLSFLSPLLNAVNPLPFRARKVREIMNGTRAQQQGAFGLQRIVWDSWTIQHKFGLPAVSLLPAVQEPITDFTFAQASVNEWFYYTEPILLRDADQYAMANGVEVRAPFMDHRLVSFALSLPDREKSNVRLKELLISSFKDQLPPEVYQRPKKGFTFPWEQWMRGDLRPFCTARITNFADRIGSSYVKQGWNEFLKGNSSISWSRWWTIVAVEDWIERNHLELE